VPDDCTVVGIPGRIVRVKGERVLSDEEHRMNLPDPVSEILNTCNYRINILEKELAGIKQELKEKKETEQRDKNK
jgi:serine O-acetyltransferase